MIVSQDGNYVFVRRMDDQVKVNGYRIELGEIEAAIGAFPAVEQTVVIVRKEKLVAYVKPKGGPRASFGSEDLDALRQFIGRSLTSYMIPK